MIDDISILKSSINSSTPSPLHPILHSHHPHKSTKSSIDPVVEESRGIYKSRRANPHSSPPYFHVDILLPRSQLLERRPMQNKVKESKGCRRKRPTRKDETRQDIILFVPRWWIDVW
jgi:hypothetical protein